MKKHLFLTTTALLAITPAIIVQAETTTDFTLAALTPTPTELPITTTAYIDELVGIDLFQDANIRTTLNARPVNYHVNSIADLQKAIYTSLSNYNTSITFTNDGSMSGKLMAEEYSKYWRTMLDIDDYLARQVQNTQYVTNGNTLTVNLIYYADYSEQQYITKRVKEIAADILTPAMNDFQKIKAINDYVVLNTNYNKLTNGSPYSVYTLLTEGEAVCQAYALLALRLYQEAGIPAHYVIGTAEGGSHAWNLVRLDGQWYHVDSTWNDPLVKVANQIDENYISYKYFLLSDSQIAPDHALDSPSGTLPKATSTKYSALHSVIKPIQIGDELLYSNRNDSNRLYLLDLSANTPVAQKISDTRYVNMLSANDNIYFSNYSNGGYLYKLDLNQMEEIPLVNERVEQIKRVGNDIVAYNTNGQVIYSEEIYTTDIDEDYDEEPVNSTTLAKDEIAYLEQQIDALNPNDETFIEDVKYVISLLENANEADFAKISNYDDYQSYHHIAVEYATLIDTINEYIFTLDISVDPLSLIEYLDELSNLIDQASPAVLANIDGLGMINFVQEYLEEIQQYENMPQNELAEAIVELLEDTEYMHPAFYENATHLYKMLFGLNDDGYELISEEHFIKMDEIMTLLDQMRAISFTNSNEIQVAPKTKDVNKAWKLKMSANLIDTTVNRDRVTVIDMFGNLVDVTVTFDKNIILIEPEYNYVKGVQYTIILQKGLQSAKGKTLKSDNYMHFTVQ